MTREAATDVRQPFAATTALPGLTSAEARRRLGEFGANVTNEEAPPRWRVFLTKFWAPIPWLLEAAIILQFGLGQYVEASVVGGLLLFNATLGFIQEGRAVAALAALKQRLAPTALVARDGVWIRLPAAELVPGDAIRLPLGAMVPADATVLAGGVLVDQSMLTGESVPVDADTGSVVYAGSLVRRGQAIAAVTATGSKTYFGRAAELVRVAHARSTEQAAIFAATRNLAVVNGTVAVLIVAYAYAIALPSDALIRLALTALLATIPVALPATFTLSAAFGAQILARRGVLLTRLSAAHEAAAIDVLCADKTGTLTRNALEVVDVAAMPGFDRGRVLALAALASSEADQDPIDAAIRGAAAKASGHGASERLVRFVPFDPETKTSEAFVLDRDGNERRIVKGAFEVIADVAQTPPDTRRQVDDLAGQGHRIIAVALGPPQSLRLAGLIALSDPPREDSAELVATLRGMGVRTLMVTGDSAVTAAAIARKVGIAGGVCPPERLSDDPSTDECGVFARVVPEEKYRLVKVLQSRGHVVGMCGDGTNDAPALRQAQIGIAVSSATDVAKAAASLVMTEPGLAGIVFAINEGRIAFQRLLAFTFNMLVKKIEIVLFLAVGLGLTGHAVITPALMVLMLVTNDFLAMSLTTDRASPAQAPSRWQMRNITAAALVLGLCKLGFSTAMLALGKFRLGLGTGELQTLAFVTLVFGSQAVLYVVRERRHLWNSWPSKWVLASSAADVAIVSALALSGILMDPLPWRILVAIFAAAIGFAFILDQVKLRIIAMIRIG
ncbi:MAG: plasma-membrane proton-efflux P-type ATPase [Betaproteobacteria bacterium]|nr:plasma-membrane proton-efflux P-type ATPase [Betaproteobacteria bacterium]